MTTFEIPTLAPDEGNLSPVGLLGIIKSVMGRRKKKPILVRAGRMWL